MNNNKIAVIFPGMGYHSDKPLLYFSKRLARENNYEIIEVNYEFPYKAREIMNDKARMKEAFEIAVSQIKEQLSQIDFGMYSDVVFIGKSIGTALAAHFDKELQVGARHIVFTPVPQTFEMLRENAGIVFHGLSDPWCPSDIAKKKCDELQLELRVEFYSERFEGITWYVQRVMNELFSLTSTGSACTVEMIDVAIDNILRANEFNYQSLLFQLPPKQKMLLVAICKAGKATALTSADFVRRWHLPSTSSVQSAIKGLLEKSFVTTSLGVYEVYDKFFAMWLLRQS